jgi:hypothetical protein
LWLGHLLVCPLHPCWELVASNQASMHACYMSGAEVGSMHVEHLHVQAAGRRGMCGEVYMLGAALQIYASGPDSHNRLRPRLASPNPRLHNLLAARLCRGSACMGCMHVPYMSLRRRQTACLLHMSFVIPRACQGRRTQRLP